MFAGLYTAIITPFKEDLSVDFEQLSTLMQYQINANVNGVVLLGTTGESPTLSTSESEIIIKKMIALNKGQINIIVGVGTNCTKTSIERAKKAEASGADAIMVVNPYYNKPTQKGLITHFTTIADAVSIPVLLYNIPGRTGVNLSMDTLKQLSRHPNIQGVKEASGDLQQIKTICTTFKDREDFSVLSGDDILTNQVIQFGGKGVVSVISNILPKKLKECIDTLLQGKLEEGNRIFKSLLPIMDLCFIETNPIPIKTLMAREGLCYEIFRLPLTSMLPENKEKLLSLKAISQY